MPAGMGLHTYFFQHNQFIKNLWLEQTDLCSTKGSFGN